MTKCKYVSMETTYPPHLFDAFLTELRQICLSAGPTFATEYLLTEVIRKLRLDSVVSAHERQQRAIEKLLAVEARNAKSTRRVLFLTEDITIRIGRKFVPYDLIIDEAKRRIRKVLGKSPPPWSEMNGGFSSGASTEFPRVPGSQALKYQSGGDVTEDALGHFLAYMHGCPRWSQGHSHDLRIVEGNVLFTVPKSTDIDRCAAKEPTLNMYLQKAVGGFIRRRLRRVGIDLNDQSINQYRAYLGSIDSSLATLDLSSASDSVCIGIVMRLLPFEWFTLLDDIRSKKMRIPLNNGESILHECNMFSSMGNGFTFELESLIFWALADSVVSLGGWSGGVSVYGDDIIVPTEAVPAMFSVLNVSGFIPNTKKSHWQGRFRESCGKHYYMGRDVTPFYVHEVPKKRDEWVNILNKLRKWLDQDPFDCHSPYLDHRFYELWSKYARKVAPKSIWGSFDYGDRSQLVAFGRPATAKLTRKKVRLRRLEAGLQEGLYLAWLDSAQNRTHHRLDYLKCDGSSHAIVREGPLILRSVSSYLPFRVSPTPFPQETEMIGVAD